MDQYWSWILTAIGLAGFFLAGKKIWWAWYINILNQVVWVAYALVTDQLGFLVGAAAYTFVFVKNAYAWTREHFDIETVIYCRECGGEIFQTEAGGWAHFDKLGGEFPGDYSYWHKANPTNKKWGER